MLVVSTICTDVMTNRCMRAASSRALVQFVMKQEIAADCMRLLIGAFIDMAHIENFTLSNGRRRDLFATLKTRASRLSLAEMLEAGIDETNQPTSNDPFQIGVNAAAGSILGEILGLLAEHDPTLPIKTTGPSSNHPEARELVGV